MATIPDTQQSCVFALLDHASSGDALLPILRACECRLSAEGRGNLLAVAIAATPRKMAQRIIAASDLEAIGSPPVVFDSIAEEARAWANLACLDERKCYMAAIWHTLSLPDQSAFLGYINRRSAA